MKPDMRVAGALAMMASACATGVQYGDESPQYTCGTDTRGWIYSAPPKNADTYRRLALDNPAFKSDKVTPQEWGHHERETWLIKTTGEVVLCLSDSPPWESWSTTFWEFAAPNQISGEISIADKGATIIVG